MDLEVTGSGIRTVGDEATAVGGRLRAADVTSPLEPAAIALPGSETARALGQLALQLRDVVPPSPMPNPIISR